MAIKYAIEKHAYGSVAKGLAQNGGAHIYSITVAEDTDNSWFVGKGAFQELDRYAAAAPTSFEGTVVAKAANGNYYVEVVNSVNAYFVASVAMIEEEYNKAFADENNFYNPANTEVRAYQVCPGDILEVSEAGFAAKPTVGDTVELKAISGKSTAKRLGKKSA